MLLYQIWTIQYHSNLISYINENRAAARGSPTIQFCWDDVNHRLSFNNIIDIFVCESRSVLWIFHAMLLYQIWTIQNHSNLISYINENRAAARGSPTIQFCWDDVNHRLSFNNIIDIFVCESRSVLWIFHAMLLYQNWTIQNHSNLISYLNKNETAPT